MAQITYDDKSAMNVNSSIPNINKVNASDMNEIKSVVNTNANNLGDVSSLVGTNNVVDALINMNTYSTSNEVVVGTWVDNKPIYRKTFYVASLPNNNYVSIAHNISNIDEIVNISGIMRSTNHTTVAFNMAGHSALYGAGNVLIVRADRTNITIGTTTNWSSNLAYITLEYTKTTD